MARIFITGSADGLGLLAAKQLVDEGHQVLLHARNEERRERTINKIPEADGVLISDLSSIEETKQLATDVNALGEFDAIIHNAGIYQADRDKIFVVNSLAPYILTCLITKPKRLIYLSSGMHLHGNFDKKRLETGKASYSDSKLHDVILAFAVARKWPDVYSNAVDPGWVPTKMGGRGAPDNLEKGYETQVWLAAGDDEEAKVSGYHFYHQRPSRYEPIATNESVQEEFFSICEKISGVSFPIY